MKRFKGYSCAANARKLKNAKNQFYIFSGFTGFLGFPGKTSFCSYALSKFSDLKIESYNGLSPSYKSV